MIIVNSLISAFLQIILFLIIPFIWWSITARKEASFRRWLGLKKPNIQNRKRYVSIFIGVIILFSIVTFAIVPMLVDSNDMATSEFAGKGMAAFLPAIIYSFLQTGFSEEIFFRGFLGKRLIHKFGFISGNLVQGLLFGLMHGAMFIGTVGAVKAIIISVLTAFIGWSMGYINEKESDGSIISSWIVHGIANIMVSFVAMFNII
jgi:membrane protease YdiL (CAAX protease family)